MNEKNVLLSTAEFQRLIEILIWSNDYYEEKDWDLIAKLIILLNELAKRGSK